MGSDVCSSSAVGMKRRFPWNPSNRLFYPSATGNTVTALTLRRDKRHSVRRNFQRKDSSEGGRLMDQVLEQAMNSAQAFRPQQHGRGYAGDN